MKVADGEVADNERANDETISENDTLMTIADSNAGQNSLGDGPSHEPQYYPLPGSPWQRFVRGRFSRVGYALATMLIVWAGLQSLAFNISAQFGIELGNMPSWAYLLASNGPLYLIAMPLAVLMMRAVPALATRSFPLGPARFFALLIMCVPIIYAGNVIGVVLSAVLSHGTAVSEISQLTMSSDPLTVFVVMVVIGPAFEEWIFRKQIISRLRRYGERLAILVSALAFALLHGNLFQFFYAFGLGLVLGYVYMRTSRLRYSMVMHMIVNFNGGIVAPWVIRQVDPKLLDALQSGDSYRATLDRLHELGSGSFVGLGIVAVYGLAMLALLVAGIVLLAVRRRRLEFYVAPEELPRGLRTGTALWNVGMIIYIVLCLLMITYSLVIGLL